MKTQADEHEGHPRELRCRPRPNCYLCASHGQSLYDGLADRMFDAAGTWNFKRCPNPRCGLIWLDPMPLEEDLANAYVNYYTHDLPSSVPEPQPGVRPGIRNRLRSAYLAYHVKYKECPSRLQQWLLVIPLFLSRIDFFGFPIRYLALRPTGRMLDVGCGNGSVLKLAEDFGWTAEGIDFDLDAAAAARRRGLQVRAGKLTDQHYPANLFDLVVMNHVIEHVPDPTALLNEIRRVLRPGGLLVAKTPNADGWGHRYFRSAWRGLEPPRHLHLFNRRTLLAVARDAGFVTISVSSTLSATPSIFILSRRIAVSGRGHMLPSTRFELIYGWAATFAEVWMRLRDPFAADELLLEIRS